jgi:hypothetical protein
MSDKQERGLMSHKRGEPPGIHTGHLGGEEVDKSMMQQKQGGQMMGEGNLQQGVGMMDKQGMMRDDMQRGVRQVNHFFAFTCNLKFKDLCAQY